jgi:hypothetical protein
VKRLLLAFAFAAHGCAEEPAPTPVAEHPKPASAPIVATDQLPVLLRYKPAPRGGPEVFRMAIVAGRLDFSGQCVRLVGPSGPRVLVTSAGSRLERDSHGLFIRSGHGRLRHGDQVEAGGGELGGAPISAEIDGTIPDACAEGPFIEAVGIHRFVPRSGPPDPPPPPPSAYGLGNEV